MMHAMIKLLPISILLVALVPLMGAEESPKPLDTPGRLLVREAQLELAESYIKKLQAEALIRNAQDRLARLIQTLQKQYACPDCELQSDFTWKPAPTADPAEVADPEVTTPAPTTASGQSTEKE